MSLGIVYYGDFFANEALSPINRGMRLSARLGQKPTPDDTAGSAKVFVECVSCVNTPPKILNRKMRLFSRHLNEPPHKTRESFPPIRARNGETYSREGRNESSLYGFKC